MIIGLGVIITGLLLAFGLAIKLAREDGAQQVPGGTFGSDVGEVPGAGARVERVLFDAFLRQQKWSFGLLWFSVAMGIGLTGYLVGRIVSSGALDASALVNVAALLGDVWLGRHAWNLYERASRRVESALGQLE